MATYADEKPIYRLQCSLCKDTFRQPKTLECTHSFCKYCLHEYINRLKEGGMLGDGFDCPLDTCAKRTPIDLTDKAPEGWVEALPTNFNLMSLIEGAQGQEEVDEGEEEIPMCEPCHQRGIKMKASLFCIDCKEPQCSKCTEVHSHFKLSANHTVISIKEMTKSHGLAVCKFDQCEVHSKLLKFYCADHEKLCCSTCAFAGHRGCWKVDEVEALADDVKADVEFRPLKGKMVALKQKIKDASTCLGSNTKQQKKQFDDIMTKIDAAEETVHGLFVELKQQVSAKESLYDNIDEVTDRQQKYKGIQSKVGKTLKRYESYVINGSKTQRFIACKQLSQHYVELQREAGDCITDVEYVAVSLQFTQKMNKVLGSKSLGTILVSKTPLSAESMMKRKLKLKSTIDTTTDRFLTDLTFLSDGRLVAVDHKTKELILYDTQLRTLATHKLQYTPLGVTSMKGDEIIITGGNVPVLRYRVTSRNGIIQLGSVTERRYYYSVSRVKEGSYLVGVFNTEIPACVINDDGVETQLDINFKQKTYGIDDTRCCYSATTDSVILTDGYANTVYIYGMSDRSELEVTDPSIVKPRGVAVSNQGCIFVCSWENNSIEQLSPGGSVISSTRCEGMKGPASICVNTEGSLMAISNSSTPRQLQIYTIE